MASRTIDGPGSGLGPLVPGKPRPTPIRRRRPAPPVPRALAASLAVFLLLSLMLVASRPAAAVSGTLEVIQSGLNSPTALAFASDGRIFFADRPSGEIWIIENGSVLQNAFYTFANVSDYHDQGLLGLALDPSFPSAPWVYAYYTFRDIVNGTVYNRIVRIHATGNTGDSVEVLLDRIPAGEWHIGGPIKFGPDGKLYALTGDAFNPANAQNLSTLAGKVLRLNPDGTVPQDDPFVGNGSANPYIFTYGHRNLFGIAFHPVTGRVYVTENGPECNDEVNLLIPGRNYGWGLSETCQHPPPDPYNTNQDGPDPVLPFIWYDPCCIAPTNAIFYDGPHFVAWHGDFFFGTWNGRDVHRLHLASPSYDTVVSDDIIVTLPSSEFGGVVGLEQGLDGAIWLTSTHTIYRFYDTSRPPIASFTAFPSTPRIGDVVTFNGSGSYDPDGSIASYAWDFGDGATGSGATVAHPFAAGGNYLIVLTVTDSDGFTAAASQVLSVRPLFWPTASFAESATLVSPRDNVTFDASHSSDSDGTIVRYTWDFGDGNIDSGVTTVHAYADSGSYTVTLTVLDSDYLTNATSRTILVDAPPVAAFAIFPAAPFVGDAITFDGSASRDPEGSLVAFAWDFGDNTGIATGMNVSHAYAQPGTHLVRLLVTDSVGLRDTKSMNVVVRQNQPPVAVLAINPTRVNPGDPVTFDASSSTDPDGSIASYNWLFGDGTGGTGIQRVHAYALPGTYTVALTVTDDRGASQTGFDEVRVNAPPTASFLASPALAYPGVLLTFNASSSTDPDSAIASYHWDFGDGTTAEGIVVLHGFGSHGSFEVQLVVTDDLGAQNETTKTIEIGNRRPDIESTSPEAALLVNVSESTTFHVTASDPDGDPITYTWTVDGVPVGGSSPSYEFVRDATGTFLIKVVVSDGSASVDFQWVVEVRERTVPPPSNWSPTSIAIVGTAVGASMVVLLLVALMVLRRRSR